MARCPQCRYELDTPNRFSLTAWRLLACPNCYRGLALVERAPKLVFLIMLLFLWLFLIVRVSRPTPFLEGAIIGGYIVALVALLSFWLWEIRHPELKLRKRPKAEITLGLSLQNPKDSKHQ